MPVALLLDFAKERLRLCLRTSLMWALTSTIQGLLLTYRSHTASEKRRSPSWCDRVLWYPNPLHEQESEWVRLNWYKSSMEIKISDHKPVMALFTLKVRFHQNLNRQTRHIDQKRFQKVFDDISRELDMLENEAIPCLLMKEHQLEFGDVRYRVPCTKSVVIENTGKVRSVS